MFQKTGGKYAEKLEIADGKTFFFGVDTALKFSEPVFHGPENSALGWVLMTTIECKGEKFMFAPDIQGPMSNRTLEIIDEEKPRLIIIGGPPLYLSGFRVDEGQIKAALDNLERVVRTVPNVILEHHLLRDENWRNKTKSVFDAADEVGCQISTAAEFLGRENMFLEAKRKTLFAEEPQSTEFEKWMRKTMDAQMHIKPPI